GHADERARHALSDSRRAHPSRRGWCGGAVHRVDRPRVVADPVTRRESAPRGGHRMAPTRKQTQTLRVLVADPPWGFSDSLPGKTRGAAKQYETLTVDEIKRY